MRTKAGKTIGIDRRGIAWFLGQSEASLRVLARDYRSRLGMLAILASRPARVVVLHERHRRLKLVSLNYVSYNPAVRTAHDLGPGCETTSNTT
jgi:hypothetical protein